MGTVRKGSAHCWQSHIWIWLDRAQNYNGSTSAYVSFKGRINIRTSCSYGQPSSKSHLQPFSGDQSQLHFADSSRNLPRLRPPPSLRIRPHPFVMSLKSVFEYKLILSCDLPRRLPKLELKQNSKIRQRSRRQQQKEMRKHSNEWRSALEGGIQEYFTWRMGNLLV